MKFYLQKLQDLNKEKQLIKTYKKAFPELNFTYREDAPWCATLIVRDKNENFIDEYQITNYNLIKLVYHMSRENKFEEIVRTDDLRKIYIRFMKKTFPEYREDYLKACNNTALENLGETNSL